MGGKPAARLADLHSGMGSLPPMPAVVGSGNVLINNRPAVRQGDKYADGDSLAQGSPTVKINNKQAGRVTDKLAGGKTHVIGSPNVMIGAPGPTPTRKPLAEVCEYAGKGGG